MSSRETTPTITGRFTSPTTSNANIIKKYPGTPKSPLLNNSSTNMGARQRLLSSKISAPRPINLPSLRREHAAGTDISNTASSAPSHGWGSTSNSPSITPESKQAISPEQHPSSIHVDSSKPEISVKKSTDHTSSPVLIPQPSSSTSRVWAVPTTQTTTQTSSNEFPTAAEAASGKNKLSLNDDKEYLKYVASDPNHTSWDEMVQVETDPDPVTTSTERPVSPSERFTEDYDRSYPPQKHYHNENYKPTYRRSEDHGYINNRYTHNDGNFDYKRHSSTDGQRQPYPSWPRRNSTDRRTSYDKRSELYPTTLLQRPRRLSDQTFISDRDEQNALQIIPQPSISSTTTNSEEITVAQKTVMLTAAERAKKRRDEQEAEYKAAAERARQKAAALAEQQAKEKSQKEKDAPNEEKLRQEVSKEESPKEDIPKEDNKPSNNVLSPQLPDVSKPWNLVAAKKGPVPEKKMSTSPIISQDSNKKNLDNQEKDTKKNNTEDANDEKDTTTNLYDKNMTEDEKNWEDDCRKECGCCICLPKAN
ncbi:uncharacterized protein BX663DRAFT_32256 [Cokeromyces recurvatus]|uniref:uncharacterized protein n=1 Tax=Cokeromyces recurvatus TaxID=90255 RepID=UPI00221FC2D5|nr:uncharacterized protein BX663DRAFT_32256 [Cokeromyces recurvatus]KAI7903504.1 hypothetical protein BX663DRAFT_32256 [Cokeromyces recurvatus]